jgi:hypothetical protein
MAKCNACSKEMLAAKSCHGSAVSANGVEYLPVKYGQEQKWEALHIAPASRCGDCNISLGGFHHINCDQEECPVCHQQLIGCGCALQAEGEGEG